MNDDEFNDAIAKTRRAIDAWGAEFPPDIQPLHHLVIGANQKCLDDLAFVIGKATRNDEESPIVRATVRHQIGRRIC